MGHRKTLLMFKHASKRLKNVFIHYIKFMEYYIPFLPYIVYNTTVGEKNDPRADGLPAVSGY